MKLSKARLSFPHFPQLTLLSSYPAKKSVTMLSSRCLLYVNQSSLYFRPQQLGGLERKKNIGQYLEILQYSRASF